MPLLSIRNALFSIEPHHVVPSLRFEAADSRGANAPDAVDGPQGEGKRNTRSKRRLRSHALTTTAAMLFAGTAMAQGQDLAARFGPQVDAQIARSQARVEALYKDIHANPELAFQEVRTAKKLADEMRALGFEVHEGVGKTGVVAILRNGTGPTVLVRADMDALPMEEKTGLPYASKVKATYLGKETFVAHSCGHDLHVAAWVGTAQALVALKLQWQGTLMFVAQPAEETTSGAKAMLQDGLFTRFGKPDVAFALHTSPALAFDEIGLNAGAITSNADAFTATFKGKGGHGSAPDKTIDPVLMASRFVVDVQSVLSREKDPFQFGVFSIGAIEGGSAANIIPESVTLRGTIRSYDPKVREKMQAGIRRTAQGVAMMAGAPEPELSITPGGDAIVNDGDLVGHTEGVFRGVFGAAKVHRVPPITASEDFSELVNAGVPSVFFFVGVYDPKDIAAARAPGGKPMPFNHSPMFAPVPEPSLKTSIKAMSFAVLSALQR